MHHPEPARSPRRRVVNRRLSRPKPLPDAKATAVNDAFVGRLLHAAAATTARFVRDRLPGSPIDWLQKPRRLFDYRSAIDACETEEGLRRTLVVHNLGLDLDTDPAWIAGIPAWIATDRPAPAGIADGSSRERQLYTASIVSETTDLQIQIFCARFARSEEEFRALLRIQFGSLMEGEATVRIGFDESEPLACALLSEAIADELVHLINAARTSQDENFEIIIEQRFST